MRKYLLPIVAVAAIAGAQSANAATASGGFNVKVNIVAACTVAATDILFGPLSTVVGTETGTSTVTVACNAGTPYSISLASGSASLSKSLPLVNGGNTIGSTLSIASAAAAGGTTAGTHTITDALAAAPSPAAGLYTGAATVYVNY